MTTFAEVHAGVLATIAAHAQAQDDGRVDDMVALYVPDAVVEIPGVAILEGAEAIRAAFSNPAWSPDPEKPQRHVTTNIAITSWSADTAASTSDVAMIKNDGTAWSVVIVARYHDEFQKVGDRWLLRRRADEYVAFTPPGS